MIEIYNDKLTEQPVMNCGELVRETVICDISGKRFAGYDFGHDVLCCNSMDEMSAYVYDSLTGGKDIDIVICDDTIAGADSIMYIKEYYLQRRP